jgi:outer membrane immunogenic protein
MMKRAASAAFAAIFISSAAIAADLPTKGPVTYAPPPPPPAWTGFYVGIHGGYGGDEFRYPFSVGGGVLTGEASLTSSGFFGGGQIGYNWQFAPSWVAGIEADIAWSGIEGKVSAVANAPGIGLSASAGSELEWFGTVRGRIGYLLTPNALLYVTGGWAFGHVETTARATLGGATAALTSGSDKSGWTAGGGIEYALAHAVTLKAEYLYVDLGRDTLAAGNILGVPFRISEETQVHTIKVGLNFKLGAL